MGPRLAHPIPLAIAGGNPEEETEMAGQVIDAGDIMVIQDVAFVSTEQQAAVVNRYWAAGTPTGTGDVVFADLAGAWAALAAADLQNLMFNGADYQGTRVRRVFPPNNDQWAISTALAGPGTAGTIALPTQSCGLIRFTGPFLGKHAEGRTYVPFPSASDNQTHGIPTASYVTRLNALGSDMVTPFTVNGTGSRTINFRPGLVQRPSFTMTLITIGLGQPSWATQKRRGEYGRTNKSPI